jgi:hypothetical protein
MSDLLKIARLEHRIAKLERQSGLLDIFSSVKKKLVKIYLQVAELLNDEGMILSHHKPEYYTQGEKKIVKAALIVSRKQVELAVIYNEGDLRVLLRSPVKTLHYPLYEQVAFDFSRESISHLESSVLFVLRKDRRPIKAFLREM